MDLTDHLAASYKQTELIRIAESVGLAPVSRFGSRRLVESINAQIRQNGIPNPPADKAAADLLDDYLYVAEFIDKHGNVISKRGGSKRIPLKQFMEEEGIQQSDCFGFADDKAPECSRCKLYAYCSENRIENLPPCFGLLFVDGNVECRQCLEAPFCKESSKSNYKN